MANVNALIAELVSYGMENGLVAEEDRVYTINRLLEILALDEYEEGAEASGMPLEDILAGLLDWAYEKGVLKENSVVYRDLFDTKLMSKLIPRPSQVIDEFWQK